MSAPRLSVVVPTFNRRERLARVLQSLAAQTVPREEYEVVVVDDGSEDDTIAWLERQTFSFEMQLHSQGNGGPALARNVGIQASRGEFVLFLDDDVVAAPELIEQHLRSHAGERSDVVVLGPLRSLPRYAQPWVAWEQTQIEKQYAAMERGDWTPTYRQFWTGNASVRRAHVLAVGMFDTGCLRGEDVELGWRLAQRGLMFRFNPRAEGFHHAERSLDSFCRAHESYGRLEVDIFGRGSSEDVISILAANFRRLHPAQRRMISSILAVPSAQRNLERALRRLLGSELAHHSPRLARPACSLLANVLYWRASAEALGAERFARVQQAASSESEPNSGNQLR